jgi:hypothetical protein
LDPITNTSIVPSGGLKLGNSIFSLLQEFHSSGLISESEIVTVQAGILDILKDLIISYTSNQSS